MSTVSEISMRLGLFISRMAVVTVTTIVCFGTLLDYQLTWAQCYRSPADQTCYTPENVTGVIRPQGYLLDANNASVVWDGTAYGVAWAANEASSDNDIYFARIAADGTTFVGPVVVCDYSGQQWDPIIVWNGSSYGIVWEDRRTGTSDIYFQSVTTSGEVPNTIGTSVCTADGNQKEPDMDWNGSHFCIVWSDGRSSGSGAGLYSNTIDSYGLPGTENQVFAYTTSYYYGPSIAWGAYQYGLVYQYDSSSLSEIRFARLNADGSFASGSDIALTSDSYEQSSPIIVWNGAEYFAVWEDYRNSGNGSDIYSARIAVDSSLHGSVAPLISDTAYDWEPSICWTGAEYGLIWERNGDVYFHRISINGSLVGIEEQMTFFGNNEQPGRRGISFGTKGFALVGHSQTPNSVFFIGLGCHSDWDPPSCPSNPVSLSTEYDTASLSWSPAQDPQSEIAYYSIYRDNRLVGTTLDDNFIDDGLEPGTSYSYTITATNSSQWESSGCSAFITTTKSSTACPYGTFRAETIIHDSFTSIADFDVVWDGEAYGVVWSDDVLGDKDIFFCRMTADGSFLVEPLPVCFNGSDQSFPAITWSGDRYGLAWVDRRHGDGEIYFATVHAESLPVTINEVRVTTDVLEQTYPDLAWDGLEYGIFWQHNGVGNTDIDFARVDESASLIPGSQVSVITAVTDDTSPEIAWNGTNYGLLWVENFSSLADIVFALVDTAGVVVPSSQLKVTNGFDEQTNPSFIWNGYEFAAAWEDNRNSMISLVDIYAARIAADGSLINSIIRVTSSPNSEYNPSIAWAGNHYGIFWNQGIPSDYYFCRLDNAGQKIEVETAFSVITGGVYGLNASFCGGEKNFFGIWSKDTPESFVGNSLGCILDDEPPSCPEDPNELGRSTTSVTLSWGAANDTDNDISHYEIFRDGLYTDLTTDLMWTDDSFDPSAGTHYQILAVDASGLNSSGCAVVDTSDNEQPTCCGGLQVTSITSSPTTITINWTPAWDAKSGVKEYNIYRDGVSIQTVNVGVHSFTDSSSLNPDTTYSYLVETVDYAGNNNANCDLIWVSTSPINLKMTKNSDNVNVNLEWNDVLLNEYRIYRSTNPQVFTELKRVQQTETTDPVLNDPVEIYYYYIQQKGL